MRVIVQNFAAVRSSRILHRDLLKTILAAPLRFYDTTPLGRILARFSKVRGRESDMTLVYVMLVGLDFIIHMYVCSLDTRIQPTYIFVCKANSLSTT